MATSFNSTQSTARVAVVNLAVTVPSNVVTNISMDTGEISFLLASTASTTLAAAVTNFTTIFAYCTGNPFANTFILGSITAKYVLISNGNGSFSILNATGAGSVSSGMGVSEEIGGWFNGGVIVVIVIGVILLFLFTLFLLYATISKRRALYAENFSLLLVYEGPPWIKGLALDMQEDWLKVGRNISILSSQNFSLDGALYKNNSHVLCLIGTTASFNLPYLDSCSTMPTLRSGEADIYSDIYSSTPKNLMVSSMLLSRAASSSQSVEKTIGEESQSAPKWVAFYALSLQMDRKKRNQEVKRLHAVVNALQFIFAANGAQEILTPRLCPLEPPLTSDMPAGGGVAVPTPSTEISQFTKWANEEFWPEVLIGSYKKLPK